jgi:fimbrial chaperone protein
LRLTFVPGKPIIAVNVENTGSEPAVVQAEVLSWLQQQGEPLLQATEDLVAVPPVFQLAPGAKQIIRVGLTRAFVEKREIPFRLIVTEVPTNVVPGTVAVSIRHSIPVFVQPSSPVKASIAINREDTNQWSIANSGTAHLRVDSWRVRDGDGRLIAEEKGPGYLLPGSSRRLPRPPVDAKAAAVFDLETDAGVVRVHAGQ